MSQQFVTLLFFCLLVMVARQGQFLGLATPNYQTKSFNPQKIDRRAVKIPLIQSYLFGYKKEVTSYVKQIHKELGIMHLMTPSGIHLSSVLILFRLLRSIKAMRIIGVITPLIFFLIDGFRSIKRIALMKLIRSIGLPINTYTLFVFLLFEILLFAKQENFIGIAMSYMFLNIFFNKKTSQLKFLAQIITAQLFINSLLGIKISLISVLAQLILPSIFTLLFPFFSIGIISDSLYLISQTSCDFFGMISETIFKLHNYFPHIKVSIPIVLIPIIITSSLNTQKKKLICFILAVINVS